MILPGSASLILSAVQQIIKLGGRIDTLLAQRSATQSQLVLGMPALRLGNVIAQVALVQQTLAATAGQTPDPFGADRAALQQQVANPDANFDALFDKYFAAESPADAQVIADQIASSGAAVQRSSARVAFDTITAGRSAGKPFSIAASTTSASLPSAMNTTYVVRSS